MKKLFTLLVAVIVMIISIKIAFAIVHGVFSLIILCLGLFLAWKIASKVWSVLSSFNHK